MQPDDDLPRTTPKSKSNNLAVASLVLGVLSFFTCGVTSLPALIVGFIALGKPTGKGLAVGGIVTAFVGILVGVGGGIAFNIVREARYRAITQNNLKEIGLAMHNHVSSYDSFPVANRRTPQGEPGLSWRVDLLPFMEQDNLSEAANLGSLRGPLESVKPWDSPEYAILNQTVVKPYCYPDDLTDRQTPFRAFDGPDTAMVNRIGGRQTFASIGDGTSNTILFAESADRVPWPKADEMKYTPNGPLPKLGVRFPNGSLAVRVDGSVHFIRSDVSERALRALITANGGDTQTHQP